MDMVPWLASQSLFRHLQAFIAQDYAWSSKFFELFGIDTYPIEYNVYLNVCSPPYSLLLKA